MKIEVDLYNSCNRCYGEGIELNIFGEKQGTCRECDGKGLILTEFGESLKRFIKMVLQNEV